MRMEEKIGVGGLRKASVFLLFVGYSWAVDCGSWVRGLRESARKLIVWMNQGVTSFQPEKQFSGLIQASLRKFMMCKNPKVFLKSKYSVSSGWGQKKVRCRI